MRNPAFVCARLLVAAVLAGVALSAAARADDQAGIKALRGGHNAPYLALGDSIAFGYNPLVEDPTDPSNYVGYPDVLAGWQGLTHEFNASCPGESSGSFLTAGAPDNGCAFWREIGLPLHTSYDGTQMAFAQSFLAATPRTGLVTLNIGGNDLLLLVQQCLGYPGYSPVNRLVVDLHDQCIRDGLPGTLRTFRKNLAAIYKGLLAHYQGQVVMLTLYPVNSDPGMTALIVALNAEIIGVTRAVGRQTRIADAFGAFLRASAVNHFDPCAAGLVVPLPDEWGGGCDVHPTPQGANVLVGAISAALH